MLMFNKGLIEKLVKAKRHGYAGPIKKVRFLCKELEAVLGILMVSRFNEGGKNDC